ncbi:MAG: DUF1294 domain-containing protein [Allorhizobium sp.]
MTTADLPLFLVIASLYNLVVFAVYAHDKAAARSGGRRVRERTLLGLALLGGGPGAFLGQRLLRHKTRKPPFAIALPLLFVVQIALAVFAIAAPQAALGMMKAGIQALAEG